MSRPALAPLGRHAACAPLARRLGAAQSQLGRFARTAQNTCLREPERNDYGSGPAMKHRRAVFDSTTRQSDIVSKLLLSSKHIFAGHKAPCATPRS